MSTGFTSRGVAEHFLCVKGWFAWFVWDLNSIGTYKVHNLHARPACLVRCLSNACPALCSHTI